MRIIGKQGAYTGWMSGNEGGQGRGIITIIGDKQGVICGLYVVQCRKRHTHVIEEQQGHTRG